MTEPHRRLLSLDLGTTAVKVAVVELRADGGRSELLARHAIDTRAAHGGGLEREQSVPAILAAVNEGVGLVPAELLASCHGVTVCDQMHGVVLWDARDPARSSRLVTWEDRRADPALCAAFNVLLSTPVSGGRAHAPVHPGYGFVTLAALLRARHPWVAGAAAMDCAGTLGAYVTNVLAGNHRIGAPPSPFEGPPSHGGVVVLADPSDAASWGCFDVRAGCFDEQLLAAVSPDLLRFVPRVVPSGSALGGLCREGARALGLAGTLGPLLDRCSGGGGGGGGVTTRLAHMVGGAASLRATPATASGGGGGVLADSDPPPLRLADGDGALGAVAGRRLREGAAPTPLPPPVVYVSVGDHAAATTAALAHAVRLAQAQIASQQSIRSRLRGGSHGSLSSLPSEGGGGGGGVSGLLPSPASSSSQLSLGGGSMTSGEEGPEGGGGGGGGGDGGAPGEDSDAAWLPGMGRLTVVVVNIGTAAQVAAVGSAVVSLLETGSDGQGRGLPSLPPGCELRPLPRVRLDGGCSSLSAAPSLHLLALSSPRHLSHSSTFEPRGAGPVSDSAAAAAGDSDVGSGAAAHPVTSGAGTVATAAATSPVRESRDAGGVAPPAAVTGGAGAPAPLMLVGASVNGGSVLAFLAERLTRWGSALADMQARARATGPATGTSPLLGPQRTPEWATRATYFYLESEAAKVFLSGTTSGVSSSSGGGGVGGAGGGDSAAAFLLPPGVAGVSVLPTLAREREPLGFACPPTPPTAACAPAGTGTSGADGSGGGMCINGLTPDNSDSPGALYAAAAQSVVRNVCGRLPASVWRAADVVVATGGALFRSAVLRRCLHEWVAQAEAAGGRARGELQVAVMDEGRAEFAGCLGAALATVA